MFFGEKVVDARRRSAALPFLKKRIKTFLKKFQKPLAFWKKA
jgi:hypothetical protein